MFHLQKRLSYNPLVTTKVVTLPQPVTSNVVTISAATIGRGRGQQVIQTKAIKPGMVNLTPQSVKAVPTVIRPQTTTGKCEKNMADERFQRLQSFSQIFGTSRTKPV